MTVGAADVLALRAEAERARIADLERLLPTATAAAAAADRLPTLHVRLDGWRAWTQKLTSAPDGWAVWDDEASRRESLVDEVLALAMTQLLRAGGGDGAVFDAADALVGELVTLGGLPPLVLGQTQELESMDHTRETVALRFPGSRVWDLPFLAHEVGHHAVEHLRHAQPELAHASHAGPGLGDVRPLAQRTARLADGLQASGTDPDRAGPHTHELTADVLATLTCGPTYAVAALCLRVPRSRRASAATQTHPSWRDRLATIRATLDHLSDETGRGRYRQQRRTVLDPLADAVLPGVPATSPVLDDLAHQVVRLVLEHRPGLVYAGADHAMEVASALAAGTADVPPAATVTAVLDGAWRWRLEHPLAAPEAVGATAARWCVEARARTASPV